MKILHLYKDYWPVLGGIENHVKLLAEGQVRQGHEVEVLVTDPGFFTRREIREGVQITKVGRWLTRASAPLAPAYPLYLLKRMLLSPPDIIHIQSPYPVSEISWLLGSFLPAFRKKPACVITHQSDVVRQQRILRYYAPAIDLLLKRADAVIASSPNYIETSPFLQKVKEKCRVVPNGIPLERFYNPDPHTVERLRTQKPGPNLLFVGRLRYYKGLQYLLQAMPEVLPEAHLIIVGSGPEEENLKALCRALNLEDRVTFAGEVSDEDLPAYYAASDLFVFPSSERSEAFGIVMLEAMAAGLPVISTELGTGTSYVNRNGETGLVVPPANPRELASAINFLLKDPALRTRLGQQSKTRVTTEFSLETMLLQVSNVYKSVLPAL
jgi:rhamnosyl/mannosyltransferase